jgi:peptidoglycan/LPS O-acetylase OafA/YrhL
MQLRNNSFDFTRFVAASGVIFSHQFPIAGFEEPRAWGISVGTASVTLFFLMSGFLICKSVQANQNFYRFVAARLLRIVPNLTFVLVATSIVTLLTYANYENWFLHLRYVAQNLLMLLRGGIYYEISGVFENRPFHALNGSLWTLPYEVWCYFILFAILKISKNFDRQLILVALALCVLIALYADVKILATAINLQNLGRLGFWFFLGAAFAAFSFNLPFLSSSRFSWFSKWGDPSYGMYIMAWPIQQFTTIVVHDFWIGMLLAWVVTTALGYATWHLFERKALLQIGPLSAFFKRQFEKYRFVKVS